MNRVVLASVAVAALAGASVIGWFEVRQAREFRRLIAVGDSALAHEHATTAIEAYSGAIALRREAMLGWLKRGDTYRRTGDFASALRDLQQASALDGTAPRPIELLGDVNAALGHHTRAAEFYSRYVALDDRAPRVLYKLALSHYRNGRPAAAIDPLKKALALDRGFTEAYYLLALCARDTRQPDQAISALTQALALNPAFAPARQELAALDNVLGRRRGGAEQLEALAALEPDRPEYVIDLALLYARAGRFESAVLTLAHALERNPDSTELHLALAHVWLDEAEGARDTAAAGRANQELTAVFAPGGHSREFLLLRGRVQLLTGDPAGAERSLQQATAALPVDPAAFRYLAAAAERLGHRELARRSRERYAAIGH